MGARELARRNNLVYWAGRHLTSAALNAFYSVEYRGTHNLDSLTNSPFILLPKHNHALDVVVEGNLVADVLDRYAYYIMKDELPNWLRVVGGIKVDKPKKRISRDMALKDPEIARRRIEQKADFKKSNVRNDVVYDCVTKVYDEGEIVIIHPEGKRNYKKSGMINGSMINRIVNLDTKNVPTFVPLDIEYEDVRKFRSKIVATVGPPIMTRDEQELTDHLLDNIDLLREI